MSPEVLIYIQKLKKYINENFESQKYFGLINENKELFFEYIAETSQKNFDDNGEPELRQDQLETIMGRVGRFNEKNNDDENAIKGTFMNYGDFGYLSLN